MKPNIRWQLLLAAACLGLVLAVLTFQVQTSGLCVTRVPAAGGILAEGIIGAPQHINPLLSDPNPVDRELVSLLFDGLTVYDAAGELQPALAEEWQVDESGRTVTFTLREDIAWHDGEPITAADVLFSYGLLQAAEFPVSEALRTLWQNVEMSAPDERTIAFTLPEPNASFLEMTTRGIVPAHILGDVPAGEIAEHPFSRFPVGSGPFIVDQNEDWQRTGRLRLLPSPGYWPQGAMLSAVEMRFFPDNGALMAAFRAGDIQAINNIPPSLLSDYLELPGLRLFTAPAERYSQLLFNLSENGAAALDSAAVRRALAAGLDRDRLLDVTLNGQGLPLEGPYLPSSWAYDPAVLPGYPFDPAAAAAALDAAGWTVGEAGVRQNQGAPFELRVLFWDVPPYHEMAEQMAQDWGQLGVRLLLRPHNLSGYREALAARDFDVALADVTPPGDPDLYDFWSQEAVVRGQNYAGWSNRRASEALEQGRQLWPVAERLPYYQAFLAYFEADLPALTLFQYVTSYGISDAVREVEIGRIDSPRERYESLASWFMLFRDVTVACPP